jgi:SAM-dependent methyltransferase
LYPETRLTGFSRNDYLVTFWSQVNTLLRPEMTVLDYGAGRGKWADEAVEFRRNLLQLKGRCHRMVGADVDEVVLKNPLLDEAVVLEAGKALPFDDASFDLIVSWAVFEHVEDPALCARELSRILKPGGVICAWTPNKWGYVGVGARLIPNRLHAPILKRVIKSNRGEADIFPTAYRLNTRREIAKWFPRSDFEHFSYVFAGQPGYHGGSVVLARFWQFLNWLLPPAFGPYLHIFLRKRQAPDQ